MMGKQTFLAALLALLISGCSKQNGTPDVVLNEIVDSSKSMVVVSPGSFVSEGGQTVSGTVRIYQQNMQQLLALENFSTTNGPDLHVYVSKEKQPMNFIDLGKLKSTKGNQVYEVPGTPDYNQYKYVLIHCQQYNHLFGSAQIK